jgi:hypothetical protein
LSVFFFSLINFLSAISFRRLVQSQSTRFVFNYIIGFPEQYAYRLILPEVDKNVTKDAFGIKNKTKELVFFIKFLGFSLI